MTQPKLLRNSGRGESQVGLTHDSDGYTFCAFYVKKADARSDTALHTVGNVDCRTTMEGEDADPPWNTRERALVKKMESYLQKSEELEVGIRELEFFFP